MTLIEELQKNPFLLAPMAGVTDYAFRSYMKELGAGILTTELVSSHGIKYQGEQTLRLMKFNESQRPIGVQLFGEVPEIVAEAAKYVEDEGADFVDLNFGCPVKKVVKKGAGSAILKDLVALQKMLRAVKSAISIPLTIKIRTGWSEESRNAEKVAQVAYDEGVTWVAIHGRTREQAYAGEADWEYIKKVKENSPLPIIGNGDIVTPELAVKRLRETGCDGVMIGRGCLKNPNIFRYASAILKEEKYEMNVNFGNLISQLHEHLDGFYDSRMTSLQIKKFASWYSSGFHDSSQFRKRIFQEKNLNDVLNQVHEYFSSVSLNTRETPISHGFMMGGHG